jgi:hypothetical protein
MSDIIDLKDPVTFEMWVEYFKIAFGAAAESGKPTTIVEYADLNAQEAVALVQKRAAERR